MLTERVNTARHSELINFQLSTLNFNLPSIKMDVVGIILVLGLRVAFRVADGDKVERNDVFR